MTMYLVLSAFTSIPVFLLVTINFLRFPLQWIRFLPIYEHHQHKPEADMYHLISSHPGLPEPY